jgi:hypothetical protein
MGQLSNLFGYKFGGGNSMFVAIYEFFAHIRSTHLPTLAIGIVSVRRRAKCSCFKNPPILFLTDASPIDCHVAVEPAFPKNASHPRWADHCCCVDGESVDPQVLCGGSISLVILCTLTQLIVWLGHIEGVATCGNVAAGLPSFTGV